MTVSVVQVTEEARVVGLFDRVGAFLSEHRLSPEPAHYTFAYHVVSAPDGVLAQAVAGITDGGVRLSRNDIEALGGEAMVGAPIDEAVLHPAPAADPLRAVRDAAPATGHETDVLIARTQLQVEGFADTVRAIHAETSGFGRDLAASAAAIDRAGPGAAIDEIARITGAMIARVRGAEIELASANREADELRAALAEARGSARLDPLTELANRRAFDEAYAAVPPGTPIAIAVCDIDHFKRVNDEFGHALGDRVLKAVGQTLAEECAGHLVARYGGEEFAVLLTGDDLDGAWATLERARSAVAARRFRSRDTDTPVGTISISAGVAAGEAGAAQEAMFANADAALYRAKAAGRNRVFRAPEIGG